MVSHGRPRITSLRVSVSPASSDAMPSSDGITSLLPKRCGKGTKPQQDYREFQSNGRLFVQRSYGRVLSISRGRN